MIETFDVDERNRIIGENLRKYRLLKGLTQDELAEGICSISQLSKVENGKTYIKRSLLKQMAERLSVTVERIESTDALMEELSETLQLAKDAFIAKNFEKAFELVQDVTSKSREFGYANYLIEGILLECRLLMRQFEYQKVIDLASRALEEELYRDSSQKVRLLSEIGYAYQYNGNMVLAYDYYTKADEEFEHSSGDIETQLRIFFELCRCNIFMHSYRTALRYIEKAEKLATENYIHLRRIRAKYIKADILAKLGEHEKAEIYFLSALKESEDNSFLVDVAIIHNNLGCLYQDIEDIGQALVHFVRAQKLFELLNEYQYLCETLIRLSEVAHHEGDFQGAISYIDKVFAIAKNVPANTYREKAQALRILGRVKATEGKFEEYVSYLQEVLQTYDENHVMIEAYEVATELADALYEKGDSRSLDMYRKAIEYNNKNKHFGLRR